MEVSPGAATTTANTAITTSSSLTAGGGGGGGGGRSGAGPMQAWWESIAKARERIKALKEIVGPLSSLETLQESERPAKGLLEEERVAQAILAHLTNPTSGHGQDALCQWLYDTFQTGNPDLQAVVLRYIPALCGLYLPRITSHGDEPLAGFEAVLLALYTAETKARNGRSLMVNIPDLSQPSLYHAPRIPSITSPEPRLGQLSAPLEPQDAVKATKRACIVGVALDLFCRRIASMPREAKIEVCQCALRWASLSCSDDQVITDVSADPISSPESGNGERVLDSNYYLGTPSPSGQVPEIEIMGPGELFLGNKSPSRYGSAHHHLHQNMVSEASSSPKWSPSMKHTSLESPLADKPNQILPSSQSVDTNVDFASSLMQAGNGVRIQLSWELLQPLIKILGHCLLAPLNSEEVKDAASAAIKALHRRAFHDLIPEVMLATGSLIRLDMASKAVTKTQSTSGNSTSSSSKPRKPEILLVSR